MVTVETAASDDQAAALDELLWQVLWEPLGLPRDVRCSFALEGPELELLAREQGRLVGGLVAVRRPGGAAELRHLAVAAPARGCGVGRALVTELCRSAAGEGSPRLQVIARSSSVGFFRALGFRRLPRPAPSHPAFAAHGISLERMEKALQGDAAAERSAEGSKAASSGAQAPILRPFTGADLAAAHELICRTIDACYAAVYPPRAVAFFRRYHAPTAIRERARTGTFLVAEERGHLVATGSLCADEVSGVFVAPERQGEGLGGLVMDALEEAALRAGHPSTRLSVSLPSRRFYERRGYRILEARSIDVGGGERLDYWEAVKELRAGP